MRPRSFPLCLFALAATVLRAQTPTVIRVVNAASLDNRLAPGCVAIVHGSNLGIGDGVVTIGGMQAPVILGTPTDMNIQIPFELKPGPASLIVELAGHRSVPVDLMLADYAPALSSADNTGQGLGTFTLPNNAQVTVNTPATPSQNITLYATGLGPTNPPVPSGTPNTGAPTTTLPLVTVGGRNAKVNLSILSPVIFGYYEVNFAVPPETPIGNVAVTLRMGGVGSNTVLLPVGKPTPLIVNLVNSASFSAANVIAPGELVIINGGNFGNQDRLNLFPAKSAEGISVSIGNVAAPLYHLLPSASRVYAVVPTETPETGNGAVSVTNTIGAGSIGVRLAPAVPGIFRIQDPSRPTRLNAAALFANSAWRVVPASMASALGWPSNCKAANLSPTQICGQPATAGDNIQIYVTGLGKVMPNGDRAGSPLPTGQIAPADGNPLYITLLQPQIAVGGVPAPVQFAGMAPGYAGLYQINFQVPRGAPQGDDVPVVVGVPGQGSDSATISIH